MREIKFRAWNFKMKKMFSAETMANDQLTLLPTGNFINCNDIMERSIIYPTETMLPMQFTGLKDKNGKEIYEGDIVKVPAGYFGETFYERTVAVVTWDDDKRGKPEFYLRNINDGDGIVWQDDFNWSHTEVIGNIWENKELI